MPEELIGLFGRGGGIAEGSDVVGEALAGQIAVDRGILIELGVDRTGLPYFDHLSELLIADEGLIDLEDGLLEDEEDRVFEDLLRI